MMEDEYTLEEQMKHEEEVARQVEEYKKRNDYNSIELESSLNKVNEIESIIKDLASTDFEVSDRGMKKAELYLNGPTASETINIDNCDLKEKINKTVINQTAFDKFYENQNSGYNTMDKEMFMKSVEEDAKRRSEDRKRRKEIAEKHKIEGNMAFRNQDYTKAISCYNQGLAAFKEGALLYNNRALACLKLGLNKRALEDANSALDRNSNSIKGVVYKAQALHNLGRFDECKETIENACKEMPQHSAFLKESQNSWIR